MFCKKVEGILSLKNGLLMQESAQHNYLHYHHKLNNLSI